MNEHLKNWLLNTNTSISTMIIEIVEDHNQKFCEVPIILATSEDISEYLVCELELFKGYGKFGVNPENDRVVYEDSLMLKLLEIYEFETTDCVCRIMEVAI